MAVPWVLHSFLHAGFWERCWAKGRVYQKHGFSATLLFHSIASCRSGSQNRQVMAEDPLRKVPLDTDLSEFLKNQAKMVQIECLQLGSGFQSLVRQQHHWDETNLRSLAFHSLGLIRPEQIWWSLLLLVPKHDWVLLHHCTWWPEKAMLQNSPSKCCGFLASVCSSSGHVSVSRANDHGYANPQMLVVNYENHCIGIFATVH